MRMGRPRTKIQVVCTNPKCPYYLRRIGMDIVRNGKNTAANQKFQCQHCFKNRVETVNTFLYRKRTRRPEFLTAARMLSKGSAFKEIAHAIGHNENTIGRLVNDMIPDWEHVNTFLIIENGLTPEETRGMWLTIKKRKKRLTPVALSQIEKAIINLPEVPKMAELDSALDRIHKGNGPKKSTQPNP